MIRIYEYTITISGTIKIKSESCNDITTDEIIKKLNKHNMVIENVKKQRM